MADRKPAPPSFTLEDYSRLDNDAFIFLLRQERERLRTRSVKALRELLVECGIEASHADARYWTRDDMVEAIAEHRVLELEKEWV